MARIEVQQAPQKKLSKREMYAMVCYYYPQYNLQEASKLTARDIVLLLKTATRVDGMKYHTLTQIVAAPYSHRGKNVASLLSRFKKMSS